VIPTLSAALLFILISTLSTVNQSTESQWSAGERKRAPYWMVLIVAIGIQFAQLVAVTIAPGAVGLAIAFLGMPVLLAVLLRRVWEMQWKRAILISAIWIAADLALQIFMGRLTGQIPVSQ